MARQAADGLSIGQLLGGGTVLTSALVFLGQHWDWLAQHGWGAIVSAAIGGVCVIAIATGFVLFAAAAIYHRSAPTQAGTSHRNIAYAVRRPQASTRAGFTLP